MFWVEGGWEGAGFLKPPSDLIICKRDSENFMKAIILTLMAYYRERIQLKISQGKKCLGRCLGKYQMWSPCCPHPEGAGYSTSPALMCDSTLGSIANQENHPHLSLQSFHWALLPGPD